MTRDPEAGTTLIEISLMSLIFTILVISIATAIRTGTKGVLMAKEQSRAMALARDGLEDVKSMGYRVLVERFSRYYYPDDFDPATPLYQKKNAVPYPTVYGTPNAQEDPWTPEVILMGGVNYWRHVVVKFVMEKPDGKLVQYPEPCPTCSPAEAGGSNPGSNLAFIEVDVTWFNQRTMRMAQVRVSTLLANTSVSSVANGEINGHVIDEGTGAGAPASLPQPLGADDSYITTGLIVTAENQSTNSTYTARSDSKGVYHITGLPNGAYLVKVSGLPAFQDSAYTTYNKGLYAAGARTVTLSDASNLLNGIDIYTVQVKKVRVLGKFQGVDGSMISQSLVVSADDGVSVDTPLTVLTNCTAASPCSFVLNNVAVPTSGSRLVRVRVENRTTPGVATATLCIDSSVTGGDYQVGWGPFVHANPCLGTACPTYVNCVEPDPSGPPLSFTTTGLSVADILLRVKVQECANFVCGVPSAPALVRVAYRAKTTGVGATLTVDAAGVATFTGVPPESAQNLVVSAWMTVTGYSSDEYAVPVPVVSGHKYDLDEMNGTGFSSEPSATERHTFTLQQVSTVSGTILKTDGTGYPGISVRIASALSEWTTIVTSDNSGRFKHMAVPVATDSYSVAPVLGTDFSSDPASALVTVGAKGVDYRTDKNGVPLRFTITPINGMLKGTVRYGGIPLRSGAVVVACSTPYVNPFPDTLPDNSLTGHFTYSTMTLTDGTYSMKVVAGVVDYYIYAYAVKDGTLHTYVSSPTKITVPAGVDTVFDFTIP